MPDLLLELFSEEIPARMQRKAAGDLRKMITDGLVDAGLTYEGAKEFWTPRRLTLSVNGLTKRSADIREERKGPRTDAPEKALAGFLRGAGLSSIDEAEVKNDPKKGDFYVAVINKPGRDAEDILQDLVPDIVKKFPWPKSMRWGAASSQAGAMRWVRPLQSILCTFGPETEEPEVISFDIEGVPSGNKTRGHRFHAPDEIAVRRLHDYMAELEKANVVLDPERRKDIILHDAKDLAFAQGLELVEDAGLLEEVSGLVEWPVVLMGEFDEEFLNIPPEVIQLTIRVNQKCFVLKDQKTGKLTNKFILVSNIQPNDGGVEVAKGNGRVVRARLSDAKFFWETDLNVSLEERAKKLEIVKFHEELGTQAERVERIKKLAVELSAMTGADASLCERAASLCKADLMTEMVYEFPELQGLMGRYYAEIAGEDASVVTAMEDHYKPQGPSDDVPTDKVAATIALADKLDTLMGFWSINEKPTGSKDPYALRRAALGVIRIVLQNDFRIPLLQLFAGLTAKAVKGGYLDISTSKKDTMVSETVEASLQVGQNLLTFFHDRLKVYLRDQDARHDLIDAVITSDADDLLMIARRVEALTAFLNIDDGQNLLAGYKRAANILAAEEKKGTQITGTINQNLFSSQPEKKLGELCHVVLEEAHAANKKEDFGAAMKVLSTLRGPIDDFFDNVKINDDDPEIRLNRLNLLARITITACEVADFERIEG